MIPVFIEYTGINPEKLLTKFLDSKGKNNKMP